MNTRSKHPKEFKLVPAAMQVGSPKTRPLSKAKLKNIERKQARAGRMVHVSATYGKVDIPGIGMQMVRTTGGQGTYNVGNNAAKRACRAAKTTKGQRAKGRKA